MSYAEKAIDRTPFIPGAGIASASALEGVNADMSLRQDLYYQPSTTTPDSIKKFRESTRQRIGVKQLHPGIYDDPKDYENFVHGVPTAGSDHVPDCIKGANIDGNKFFMNQLAESHYASSKREPLGKSIVRNYKFPEIVKSDDFKFGIPTTGFFNAKELIYNGNLSEPDDVKLLYYKTLNNPFEIPDILLSFLLLLFLFLLSFFLFFLFLLDFLLLLFLSFLLPQFLFL